MVLVQVINLGNVVVTQARQGKLDLSKYGLIHNSVISSKPVINMDNREFGFHAINFSGINLFHAGYKFEIYFAEGQKSPHLHVKDIHFLEDLDYEQIKKIQRTLY